MGSEGFAAAAAACPSAAEAFLKYYGELPDVEFACSRVFRSIRRFRGLSVAACGSGADACGF